MKFYFIRHGQTTCNISGAHQGWGPIRLSELGREQAKAAHEKLKNISFAKYYCSDLLRTKQTAEIIFPEIYHSGKINFAGEIREVDTGACFGKTPKELTDMFGEEYIRRRQKMDYGIFGMESSDHLKARLDRFKKQLEAEANELRFESELEQKISETESEQFADLHKNTKYAIVTHGGVIKAFTLLVSGLPENVIAALPAGTLNLNISNCSVNIFDYRPERGWSIDAIGI